MQRRLTRESALTIDRARDEASRLRHTTVSSEHLLLAAIADPAIAELLSGMGMTKTDVRQAIRSRLEPGSMPVLDEVCMSDQAEEVLAAAFEEVVGFGHTRVNNAHLMLGLLKEPEGLAGRILEGFGATVDGMRHEVLEFFAEREDAALC